jgi:hypothetical protein
MAQALLSMYLLSELDQNWNPVLINGVPAPTWSTADEQYDRDEPGRALNYLKSRMKTLTETVPGIRLGIIHVDTVYRVAETNYAGQKSS